MKHFLAIMLIVIAVFGQANGVLEVQAVLPVGKTDQGIVEFSAGDARIEVRGNEGQTLVGKTFYLHQLFEAENSEDLQSINYTINERYEDVLKEVVGKRIGKDASEVTEYEVIDYMQSLNSYVVEGAQAEQTVESSYSEYRYFVEELCEAIYNAGILGSEIRVLDTKADNSIEIRGLEYGYYMVQDATVVEGDHTAVSMSMLGTTNPEAVMNIKSDYPSVTKKILEDDNRESVGNNGWNDIGDYEIGQDVPFRYESNIPNMNGYDTYYYAWHDVMDEALTLQEDSIQIVITGSIDSVEKEYKLAPDEFQLLTNVEGETFVIEVADIKAIVDREFDQINERKENIYDQKVVVTYAATLNEKAALNPGRPGFENEVRLEFSNDPTYSGEGVTGYTPWDTVVCFTYQMNGSKVDNYGKELSGAVFRLYYDEECTNEVYVKEIPEGYCIMNQDSWTGESPENAVSIESAKDGSFYVYGLDSGTYYLKEISAPEGYRELLDPIKIEITSVFPSERNNYIKGTAAEDGILDLIANAHITTFTNGKENAEDVVLNTDAENGNLNLSVVNEAGKKLPITGSYLMPVFVIAGVLFMCLSVRKGRRKHE